MKKDFPTIILVFFIGLLFAGISFLVFITFGKSKKFVNWKVKVGAWLIVLTTVVNTGCPITTCYVPPYEPYNEFEVLQERNYDTYRYEIDLNTDSTFSFVVYAPDIDTLEYRLSREDSLIDSGVVEQIKKSEEDDAIWFDINFKSKIDTGLYSIDIIDTLDSGYIEYYLSESVYLYRSNK